MLEVDQYLCSRLRMGKVLLALALASKITLVLVVINNVANNVSGQLTVLRIIRFMQLFLGEVALQLYHCIFQGLVDLYVDV